MEAAKTRLDMKNPDLMEIELEIVRQGCCAYRFDEVCPRDVHGSMKEDDFLRSIRLINRSIEVTCFHRCLLIVSLLAILVGLVVSVLGGILEETLNEKKIFIDVAFGVVLIIGGSLLFLFCYVYLNSQRSIRLTDQLEQQSNDVHRWTLQTNSGKDDRRCHLIEHQWRLNIQIDGKAQLPSYEKCTSIPISECPPPLYSELN